MYFDFEDYRPEITPVGQVISWREGVLLSIIAHMALIILVMLSPQWFPVDPYAVRRHADLLEPTPRDSMFAFVQPNVDLEALRAPALAPLSDKSRVARSPEPAVEIANPLPAARGNSVARVEEAEPARGRDPGPAPAVEQPEDSAARRSPNEPPDQPRIPESPSTLAQPIRPAAPRAGGALGTGSLGNSLQNLGRYLTNEQFDNSNGAAQFGQFQFDTKGVEFGPWVRRFAQQVQRNWDPLIPNGPMLLRQRGKVVVTLNVHKNGTISDVSVLEPCPIEGFNTAAYGALVASNPTQPLPPEYPADKVFFTITFYYNERAPGR